MAATSWPSRATPSSPTGRSTPSATCPTRSCGPPRRVSPSRPGWASAQRRAVHRFQTRAGVSAGGLRIAFVGGVGDRWELMPVGSPIDDVARAERLAPAGAVAIAAPAWELVRSRCDGRELDDGVVELTSVHRPRRARCRPSSLTAPDPPDELLAPFVPLSVRRRQLAADTEWMQEKRRVTVVMTNLATAGADDGDLELAPPRGAGLPARDGALRGCREAARGQQGGHALRRLRPSAARAPRRRAPRRTAAETIRRELEDIGLLCTIGIATGRAFCGVFGSDLRREYTLHGEVINMAARLMEVSRGEILCADATVQAARDSVTFDALEPVSLKGPGRAGRRPPRVAGTAAPRTRASRRWSGARPSAALFARAPGQPRRPGARRRCWQSRARRGSASRGSSRRRSGSPARAASGCWRPRPTPSRARRATTPGARSSPTCSASRPRRWPIRTPCRCRATRSCAACGRC